jgi:hypothetical protein
MGPFQLVSTEAGIWEAFAWRGGLKQIIALYVRPQDHPPRFSALSRRLRKVTLVPVSDEQLWLTIEVTPCRDCRCGNARYC